MKRSLILFLILGLSAGAIGTAEADQTSEPVERTVEARYLGPWLPVGSSPCASSNGAGCVTIETDPTETSLTAKVTDAHGQPVLVTVAGASGSTDLYPPAVSYGSFCGQTKEPIVVDPGVKLEFWIGYWWPRWWIIPEVECEPGMATTGTITVTLSGGRSGPSTPPPDESASPQPSQSPEEPEMVARSVELTLRGHLRGLGGIISDDPSCHSAVPVVVQRKSARGWVDVASATTDADGAFDLGLRDRSGRYRAMAPEVSSPETCLAGVSATARHRH